jgi:hypothetical protein
MQWMQETGSSNNNNNNNNNNNSNFIVDTFPIIVAVTTRCDDMLGLLSYDIIMKNLMTSLLRVLRLSRMIMPFSSREPAS